MIRRTIGSVRSLDEIFESLGFETVGGQLRRLRAELDELKAINADYAVGARAKLDRGQAISRPEAAAFLGVSAKKLQRMERAGTLVRCPGLGTVVRYAARDVLRLASAV